MKKKYLLDTSIIAFLFRKAYNIGNRLRELDSDQCFVSEITIAEFSRIHGIQLENWVVRS